MVHAKHPSTESDVFSQLRRELQRTLQTPEVPRPPQAPPNSPVSSPRRLDGRDARRASFDGDRTPSRPVATSAPLSSSSVLGVRMAQLGAPPPAPPAPPLVIARAPERRAETPAEILAKPANAGKSVAEKMQLFLPPSLRPVAAQMAADPTYRAMFTEMAARPPENLPAVLQQMAAVENLRAQAGEVAGAVHRGLPTPPSTERNNVPGELLAGRLAGYQVHPHTYAGAGSREAMTAALGAQVDRDAQTLRSPFTAASGRGELARFYGAFSPLGDAACHAARMNRLMETLEQLQRAEADPFDGSHADTSSTVLQAAYQAAGGDGSGSVTPAAVRSALAARGVPDERIARIVAALREASLCDD